MRIQYSFLSGFLLFFFIGFQSFVASANDVQSFQNADANNKFNQYVRELIRRSDPYPQLSLPIRSNSNDYQVPDGPLIDASCFEKSRKDPLLGMFSDFDIKNKITFSLYTAAYRVLGSCVQAYPELSLYTKVWANQFRRTRMVCEWPDFLQNKMTANQSVTGPFRMATRHLSFGLGYSGIIEINTPFTLFSLLFANYQLPIYGIVHEFFHTTTANNLGASIHNRIENIDDLTCSESKLDDRISIVSELCVGKNENSNASNVWNAQRDLFRRMNFCGFEKGCVQMFSATITPKSIIDSFDLIASKGMEYTHAKKLCQRIYRQGYGEHIRETQGKLITLSHRSWKKMKSLLISRLSAVYPKNHYVLPRKLIQSFPFFNKMIVDLARSSPKCFKSVFQVMPNGVDLVLIGHHRDSFFRSFNERKELFATFGYSLRKNMIHIFDHSASFCTIDEQKKLMQGFDSLQASIEMVLESRIYQFALERIDYEIEGKEDVYLSSGFPESEGHLRAVSNFFGSSLLNEYLTMLRFFHYKSPDWDASRYGISLPSDFVLKR